ncbi:hypothetical protein BASA81_000007 [Batrachochytrium salamandrivorans]|nr:hypothetical protein BASA81_000007 [Batrachochytrium salamandrivorans]
MAVLPVELTIAGFKQDQLRNTLRVTTLTAFLVALTSTPHEDDSPSSGLAEFLATPLIASLGDKTPRRFILAGCLLVMGLARGLLQGPLALQQKLSFLPLVVAAARGGFLASIRASIADFSINHVQMTNAWIRVGTFAALGALAAPVFRRVSGMVTRLPLAPLVALVLAGNVVFSGEDELKPSNTSEPLHPVSLTPLSFTRLFTNGTPMAASFASLAAEMVRLEDLVVLFAKTEAQRVQLIAMIGLSAMLGNGLSGALQQRFGLENQSRFALAFQLLTGVCLLGGEPEIAAVLTMFCKRAGDRSDVALFKEGDNTNDDGNGQRSGALNNLKVVGQTVGSVSQAFLASALGAEAAVGFALLSAIAAEALRSKLSLSNRV